MQLTYREVLQNLTFSACVLSLHSSEVGDSHFQDVRLLHLRITRGLDKTEQIHFSSSC